MHASQYPGIWLRLFVISVYAHLCLYKPSLVVRNLGLPALFPLGIRFKNSDLLEQLFYNGVLTCTEGPLISPGLSQCA